MFVKDGRRHYRRTYSLTEVRLGVLILAGLGAIAGWIVYKGTNPDPALFAVSATLRDRSKVAPVVDRGPVPERLAAKGWVEGPVSHYDAENLYVKINGRADYYKSFGFERLHYVTLSLAGDASTTVDIEMYDLGKPENAVGAYAGERPPDSKTELKDAGLQHVARNALMMTRGRYYVRAIGSDESETVVKMLGDLAAALDGLSAQPLPWAYALFAGGLGYPPSKISYMPEDAFSFGFAKRVYAAMQADDETEVFVVAVADPSAARALAAQFTKGFASLGTDAGRRVGVPWLRDRYLGGHSAAKADGSWVLGVRGAPALDGGVAALEKLTAAVHRLPETVQRAARPTEAATPTDEPGVEQTPEGEGY